MSAIRNHVYIELPQPSLNKEASAAQWTPRQDQPGTAAALTAELHRGAALRGPGPCTPHGKPLSQRPPARTPRPALGAPQPCPGLATPASPGRPSPGPRARRRGTGPAAAGERDGQRERRRRSRSPTLRLFLPEFTANGAAILGRGKRVAAPAPKEGPAKPSPPGQAGPGVTRPRPRCRRRGQAGTGQPRARADGSCSCRLRVHRASRLRIPSRRLRERESAGLLHSRLHSADVNVSWFGKTGIC